MKRVKRIANSCSIQEGRPTQRPGGPKVVESVKEPLEVFEASTEEMGGWEERNGNSRRRRRHKPKNKNGLING
jgi:hypothetical protein